jgi:AcrR family transcriptional regulator
MKVRSMFMQLNQRKTAFIQLKEQEREARRNIIIDAAEKVFATKQFNKVNMRDIAKEAGISPALIYRYFPDQQHLFVEAFLRGTQQLIEIYENFITTNKKISIEDAAKQFIAFLSEHEQYFKMMTHFMLDGEINTVLLDKLNTIERSMLDTFDLLFKKIGVKGNTRMISHSFFACLNGILITFRQHPGRTREQVQEHMDHIGAIVARLFDHALAQGEPEIFE